MAPTLDDYQMQFGDSGVLLNGDDGGLAPFVDVSSVTGLDSATYRTSSKDVEGQDGSTIEAEFESKRTITITGLVYGQTHEQMEPYIDRLKASFAVSRDYKPFYFKAPGVAMRKSLTKCTSGFRSNWEPMRRLAMANFSVTLEAGDSILYGVDEYLLSGEYAVSNVPGFSFPFAFNFDFGAIEGGQTGSFNGYHYGNRPAPFIARFTGVGVTNPGLRHEGLNRQVLTNLSLDVGDELLIDFRTRKVLLNGVPRRGSVTREGWFLLAEGVVNPLRVLTSTGTLSVTLSVNDAWR
jgi:hypothetical protein